MAVLLVKLVLVKVALPHVASLSGAHVRYTHTAPPLVPEFSENEQFVKMTCPW